MAEMLLSLRCRAAEFMFGNYRSLEMANFRISKHTSQLSVVFLESLAKFDVEFSCGFLVLLVTDLNFKYINKILLILHRIILFFFFRVLSERK